MGMEDEPQHPTMEDLIAASTFGSPEALEIRALTPLATRHEILAGLLHPDGLIEVFMIPQHRRRWPTWPRKFLR